MILLTQNIRSKMSNKEILNSKEFKEELELAINKGYDWDYAVDDNGDDYQIEKYDLEVSFNKVMEVLNKYFK